MNNCCKFELNRQSENIQGIIKSKTESIYQLSQIKRDLEHKLQQAEAKLADAEKQLAEYATIGVLYGQETAKDKIKSLEAKLEKAVAALNELGHYGIDFGYGPYDCDVAKIAQDTLKEIQGEHNETGGRT